MSGRLARQLERRVLILAPVGKDAALIEVMLGKQAIVCLQCRSLKSLCLELDRGAAALLVAEEALNGDFDTLAETIARQSSWSDLPVLLLTRSGADSATVNRAMSTLGNVTLLERPVRVATLLSAVRSAMRARARHYQTREHLLEREQADRRKDEFLATLAHELRNPLAPIRNAVALLRMSEPQRPEICEMIARQVDVMVRLIDDLMDMSRISRGTIVLRKEVIDLAQVVHAAVEVCRPLVQAARHELVILLPQQPLPLEADAIRLVQVFSNLLNNAVKYTDPGGAITVEVAHQAGTVITRITDTGIGIAADALPRIFDLFVQIDGQERRAQSGLGIGLTLARKLVEMHGGTLQAASAGLGQGSQFTVSLPMTTRPARVTPAEGDAAPKAAVPSRVLVVDDNRDAANSLGALLSALGAQVQVSYGGESALTTLAQSRPSIVFLDLGMPGMSGYELARRIRECPDMADVVLVAVTGWGQAKDRRATQAAGFTHHLVKPAELNALQAILATVTSPR